MRKHIRNRIIFDRTHQTISEMKSKAKGNFNPCFLCCVKVKTGAMAIATLEIVGYSLGILLFSLVGSMYRSLTHSLSPPLVPEIEMITTTTTTPQPTAVDSSHIRNFRFQLLFTLSLVSVTGLFGGILLALGLKFKGTGGTFFFKFWMALKSIQILAIVILMIVDYTKGFWDLRYTYFIIYLAVSFFFFLVIFTHLYNVIQAKRSQSMQTLEETRSSRRSSGSGFGGHRTHHYIDDEGVFEEEDNSSNDTQTTRQNSRQHTIDMDTDEDEMTTANKKNVSKTSKQAKIAPHA